MFASRRQFLLASTAALAPAVLPSPLRAALFRASNMQDGTSTAIRTLDTGWQYRKGPLYGIEQVWHTEEAELWETTSLPHCINAQDACDPDQPYFRGHTWYRTHLQLANPYFGGRTLLHFRGAGQTTSLFIGPSFIGIHKGGYDEFTFDITDAVAALPASSTPRTAIPVAVLCDNSPDIDRVPSDLSDFCIYGGLYRHVHLVYQPAVALEALHILSTVTPTGPAQIALQGRLANPLDATAPCTLTIGITDPAGRSIHTAQRTLTPWNGLTEIGTVSIPNPQLWSPDAPHLYRCIVTLSTTAGESTLTERFGLRHLEWVENGPFKLNGERILLRGTHRHMDHAAFAAAQPDDLVRQEMQLIKQMGVNFIRLAHYQQDSLVLDLCDELGIMVWEEVPWCRAGVGSPTFQQQARGMLTNMIDQHIHHPAIILWGLGNEDDWPTEYPSIDKSAIRAFMTGLRDLAHSLDASRLTSFRRCAFAVDIPDVYSPSIWAGWYSGRYTEYEKSLLAESKKVKHFIHMEWGADSQAGRHSEDPYKLINGVATGKGTDERGLAYLSTGGDVRVSKDGDWSETYACDLFDWHLKTQEKLPWLTGAAQWIFKDFATPLRPENGVPNVNQKGVVQRDLTLKESYFVFQSYWSPKLMAHIYGHTWPTRWGPAGESRIVKVYSNCEHAELFLNNRSLGIRQRNPEDFPAAGLHWQVPFATGPNHLRVLAHRGSESIVDELDLHYETEPWSAPSELRLVESSHTPTTTTVEATLHDANGHLCLDSRAFVRFSLAGPGRLIDNLGTTHGSRLVQLANGRTRITIEHSTERNRMATVGITSPGLPSAFLRLGEDKV